MPTPDAPLFALDGTAYTPADAAVIVTELSKFAAQLVAANRALSEAVAGLGDLREPEALLSFADEWLLWANTCQSAGDGYAARVAAIECAPAPPED